MTAIPHRDTAVVALPHVLRKGWVHICSGGTGELEDVEGLLGLSSTADGWGLMQSGEGTRRFLADGILQDTLCVADRRQAHLAQRRQCVRGCSCRVTRYSGGTARVGGPSVPSANLISSFRLEEVGAAGDQSREESTSADRGQMPCTLACMETRAV